MKICDDPDLKGVSYAGEFVISQAKIYCHSFGSILNRKVGDRTNIFFHGKGDRTFGLDVK